MIEDAEEQIQMKKKKLSEELDEEEKVAAQETPVVVPPLKVDQPLVEEKVIVIEQVEEIKPKEVPI